MRNTHKGSALLIVLGMIAFMVVSAVAFSAYMRYSRLPSSYLRQTSASRLLAKAALAYAIDEIDTAIGNMPHPGLWNKPTLTDSENEYYYPRSGGKRLNRNIWKDRVYIGNCDEKSTGKTTSERDHLVAPYRTVDANGNVDADENAGTVSTLTLEGLAYIPPPLVAAARYYSRRSNAAKWHQMEFDAGRYAFCAIDVSDYFDVNAMAANVGRGSFSAGRVSLAHVFENPETTPGDPSAHQNYAIDPSRWDTTFMEQFRTESAAKAGVQGRQKSVSSSKVPLVSVADLNLALYQASFQDYTPFSRYVAQDLPSFYSGFDQSGRKGNVDLKQLTFVTDGWFPPQTVTDGDGIRDLDDPANQPFSMNMSGPAGGSTTLGSVMNSAGRTGTGSGKSVADRIRNRISGLGMAELYDYLDENNVPVSLSIPSTERTPMICGIEPKLTGGSVTITAKTDPEQLQDIQNDNYANVVSKSEKERRVSYKKNYYLGQEITAVLGGTVEALVAYPFRRGVDVVDPDTFPVDGHVAIYLATGDFKFRTNNDADLLHLTDDGSGSLGMKTQNRVLNDHVGVLHAQIGRSGRFSLPSLTAANESDYVRKVSVLGEMEFANDAYNALRTCPLLSVTYEQNQARALDGEGQPIVPAQWNNTGEPVPTAATCQVRPVGADGRADPDFDDAKLLQWISGGGSKQVSVRAAVWLRVRNGDSRTVDLVPACLSDDKTFLNVDNFYSMGPAGSDDLGSSYPLIQFNGGTFTFGLDKATGFDAFTPVQLEFKTPGGKPGILCCDPRWNWAPEHWYAADTIDAAKWLQDAHDFQNAGDGRDRDIFLATSDAGYLQSVYELAFLPRVTRIDDKLVNHNFDGTSMGHIQSPNDAGLTDWPAAAGGVRNAEFMWRTYCPYDRKGCTGDLFDEIGIVNAGSGVKVNPYSDDTNVVMAAFANTPFDWWAASTNRNVGVSESERLSARQFNTKYAFNALSGNQYAKFAWKDLKRVAQNLIVGVRQGLRSNSNYTWEDAYDDLDWSGTLGHDGSEADYFCTATTSGAEFNNEPLDGSTDPLWSVDRKFLYGFWRECFAARQQLFLVFVRAEPCMMGGGAVGKIPPALGARAVALVWRDPAETETDNGSGNGPRPHRTRVLFYRQFE